MDLWWKIAGYCRIRLTGADPMRTLRLLSREIRLEQIEWESGLSISFDCARRDRGILEHIAERQGDRLEVLGESGFPQLWKTCRSMPGIMLFLVVLTGLSLWIPSRILFVQVEGNQNVPTSLILETAEKCGVGFGASRKELRSEEVKNSLLHLLPELSWAGVNTEGCVATITVRERQQQPPQNLRTRGDIVAARSGIVTSFTSYSGTPLCKVGQAVQKGQVLISGVTDVGLKTRVTAAEGEVFADTVAEVSAVLPRQTLHRGEDEETFRRYSLIIGKKHIKFDSDSGILYPGCGKMKEVIPWKLPGGWQLPVSLVIDTYTKSQWDPTEYPRWTAEEALLKGIRRQISDHAVAAEIRNEQLALAQEDALFRMEGKIGCREMIGRTTEGVYLEDDTNNDRSSSERGAG